VERISLIIKTIGTLLGPEGTVARLNFGPLASASDLWGFTPDELPAQELVSAEKVKRSPVI
jgi:hypothetical protein